MDIQLARQALTALCAPHAAREESAPLIAELAVQGTVTVLDCGNRFAGYLLMQHLRLRMPDPMPAIRRVFVRRAFTCHQVSTLLVETPARPQPCILLDMLATFQDENVPLEEASRLLEGCLREVARLARSGPMLVTLAPPHLPERAILVERVCEAAQRVYRVEMPAAEALQAGLFG